MISKKDDFIFQTAHAVYSERSREMKLTVYLCFVDLVYLSSFVTANNLEMNTTSEFYSGDATSPPSSGYTPESQGSGDYGSTTTWNIVHHIKTTDAWLSSGSHDLNTHQTDNRNSNTTGTPMYTVTTQMYDLTSFEAITTAFMEGTARSTDSPENGQNVIAQNQDKTNKPTCNALPNYCLNNGKCFDTRGRPSCWCPSSSQWWFRGERCETSESILKLSLIAGGCGAFVVVLLGFLLLCMARMAVKKRPPGQRPILRESVKRIRIPHSSASMFVNERALGISPAILSPVPPTFDATDTDDDFRRDHPMSSTMVKYEQLGTITKQGESRTKFTSSGFTDVESIDETVMSTGYSRSADDGKNQRGKIARRSTPSKQCRTGGSNWQLNRSPNYDVRK
uniref:uncharacterized protein LOC120339508 n=1 Tax=Styela clava TaxID=7725 RepID=UPI001939F3BA|nr:uncharacterized protein LOC120339508 [Styela clava]